MIDCAFMAFDFCCTAPCVFSSNEIMSFSFRLTVVGSVVLLVRYHYLFLFFSFLILTSKQFLQEGKKRTLKFKLSSW